MGNVLVTKQVAMALFEAEKRMDVSPRTRCVVLKQFWKSEGRFPSSLELPSWYWLHTDDCFAPEMS